jgi:Amt family ammonium transporter
MSVSTADFAALEARVTALGDMATAISDVSFGEDVMWLLICATLVFFMQAGFAMLEAGAVRSKNAVNILFKNLVDGAISCMCFWWLGYGFAYGKTSGGFIGTDLFGLTGDEFDLTKTDYINYQSFFFQWAFAATAATIVSGCVAERCKLEAYFIYSAFISLWIYPVIVHWCWGQGWLSPFADDTEDYLFYGNESNNFVDFAGSGIVHTVGGVAGLVGAIALGPRKVCHMPYTPAPINPILIYFSPNQAFY